MKRIILPIVLAVSAAACAPAAPATAPAPSTTAASAAADPVARGLAAIEDHAIRAHVRFLSHDLMEGRAPGTRGGTLAAEYIATEFMKMGLEPVDGSYFQRVPILAVTADPAAGRLTFVGPDGRLEPRSVEEFVSWTLTQSEGAEAAGELVFAGYGIVAPEQQWDDYADLDVRGKVVMVLVNDPPATEAEPDLFGGRAMTYYGRWTYKLEEAERQGAAGVVLVHTPESATYGWNVVTGSWTGPQYQLPLAAGREAPLPLAAWVTEDAARRILATAGMGLDSLTAAARTRGFRARPTGIQVASSIRSTIERTETANVMGLLRGTGDEVIVYGGHYDHLGIGAPVDGDSIYNGALDNASGVGVILEVADAFRAAGQRPARSVLFVAIAAEESGLLGSSYFVENPPFPVEKIAANLNIDMTHLLGPTRDIEQLGGDRSTLGEDLEAVLGELGLRSTGDQRPEAGSFFRSDHFPFAKAGIPALYFKSGGEVEGRPEGWAREWLSEFSARHYHQPSDEYREEYDFRGAAQVAGIAFRLGWRVANAERAPEWLPTSEFQRR